MHPLRMILCVAATLIAGAAPALAQFNRGGGQSNGMSMGGFSGGGMGGMSSGMGGMGGFSSGLGGMGGGMGGFGGGMGMGGMSGGMGGFGSSSLGGTGAGQGSFGNGQQSGQGFVGRDSADMTSVFNELGRNSNQFMQQLNRTMSRGNRGGQSASQEQNVVLPVRVQLNVAFDHPQVSPTVIATTVRGRLEKYLARRSIAAPGVEVVGDTVVLRGVAPSESQRLVIEKLVSLEPGVVAVDNQMTVAQSTTEQSPHLSAPVPPQADN
jgi:osmotically-inducible protein OsmY